MTEYTCPSDDELEKKIEKELRDREYAQRFFKSLGKKSLEEM